jgi:hypothetical protein
MRVTSFTSTVDGDDSEDVESVLEEGGLDIIFQASTKLGEWILTRLSYYILYGAARKNNSIREQDQ